MKKPDKGDVMILTGLGLIGYGLSMWMLWVSLTTVGVIVLALGFMSGIKKGGN